MEQLILIDALNRVSAKRNHHPCALLSVRPPGQKAPRREPISARLLRTFTRRPVRRSSPCLHPTRSRVLDGPVDHMRTACCAATSPTTNSTTTWSVVSPDSAAASLRSGLTRLAAWRWPSFTDPRQLVPNQVEVEPRRRRRQGQDLQSSPTTYRHRRHPSPARQAASTKTAGRRHHRRDTWACSPTPPSQRLQSRAA